MTSLAGKSFSLFTVMCLLFKSMWVFKPNLTKPANYIWMQYITLTMVSYCQPNVSATRFLQLFGVVVPTWRGVRGNFPRRKIVLTDYSDTTWHTLLDADRSVPIPITHAHSSAASIVFHFVHLRTDFASIASQLYEMQSGDTASKMGIVWAWGPEVGTYPPPPFYGPGPGDTWIAGSYHRGNFEYLARFLYITMSIHLSVWGQIL